MKHHFKVGDLVYRNTMDHTWLYEITGLPDLDSNKYQVYRHINTFKPNSDFANQPVNFDTLDSSVLVVLNLI